MLKKHKYMYIDIIHSSNIRVEREREENVLGGGNDRHYRVGGRSGIRNKIWQSGRFPGITR
jgi:hypothetical protein